MTPCAICLHRLTELEEAGMVPNLVAFNTLLKACMRSKDMPRAHQVLARVRAAGLQVAPLCTLSNGVAIDPHLTARKLLLQAAHSQGLLPWTV